MNILLVNHYAGSPQHGMEFRPHQLAAHWVSLGHEVTIAAGSWSHLRNENPETKGRVSEQWIDGIRYRWYRTNSYRGNGLSRLWSMRRFTRHLAWDRSRFFRANPPDCVIASSTYPFDVPICARIASDHAAPLIWEVHDLWPLSQIELYGFSPAHPFVLLTSRAERFACTHADRVVSILPLADRHLRTRGLPEDRYTHVPNGICPEESRSAMRSPPLASAARVVEAARADERFVVAYAGGHAPNHDLDTLIDAARMVRNERFCFILMGSGPAREALIRRAQAAGLEHVHFLERASRGVALSTLSLADAVYAGIAEGSLYRYGIGLNKIYDAMFVGRPIVAAYTAGNDPVTDAQCGMTSPAGDVERVTAALRHLAKMDTSSREAMGLRGHRFVLQNHDYRVLAARFLEEIEVARAAM